MLAVVLSLVWRSTNRHVLTFRLLLYRADGPNAQYLWFLTPSSIKGTEFGTRTPKCLLFGFYQKQPCKQRSHEAALQPRAKRFLVEQGVPEARSDAGRHNRDYLVPYIGVPVGTRVPA